MATENFDLNEQQSEAVNHDGSALVLSGAGTGKTRVITARIQKLLDDGVPASSIMAVTYTNKSAMEMRERIGQDRWTMFVGTFHSFCLRLLQRFYEQAGLPKNFQVIDSIDQEAIVRGILTNDMSLPKKKDGGPDPRSVRNAIDKLKNHGLRASEVEPKVADQTIIKAYEIYEQKTASDGKVDYSEMLLGACELLERDQDVRSSVTERFTHVLIDELQDISSLQVRLLKSLRAKGTVFFGVGDDDQSIYRFRGANPGLLRTFAKDYAGGVVLRLERNYRSTNSILNLANWVISQNSGRMGKVLHGVAEEGNLPDMVGYPYDEDEAKGVAREVSRLIDEGINPGEMAVLYRNNALSQLLEVELAKKDVPFRIHGGVRFFSRAEIKDVLAYLRVADDPSSVDSIARSINTPPRGVGKKAWEAIEAEIDSGEKPWDVLKRSDQAGIKAYVKIIEAIRAEADEGKLVEAARIAVEDSGLQQRHIADNAPERAEHLDEIINAAARLSEELPDTSLSDFLASVAIEGEVIDSSNSVTLMTIHSAKGLEFDNVFLIGLEEGILPSWSVEDQEELEEERRLLYVAITRARKKLVLSCAKNRRVRGSLMSTRVSRLLSNVERKGLVETEGDLAWSGTRGSSTRGSSTRRHQAGGTREPVPDVTASSVNGYEVGRKVVSNRFGPGVILALAGSGDKAKAKVMFFKDRKQRWLVLALANLR